MCFCVFFLFFLFSIFKTVSHFCFFHLWKVLERTEVRETIAVFRPWTQKICSSPSILRLNLCLNSTLSHGTILRKESLVLCLAILLFSVAFILSKVNWNVRKRFYSDFYFYWLEHLLWDGLNQKSCFLYNLWGYQRELFVSFLSSTTSFLIFPFPYGLLDLLFIDSKH